MVSTTEERGPDLGLWVTWRPACGVAMYAQRHDTTEPFRNCVVTGIVLTNVNVGVERIQVIDSQEPSIRHDFVTAMVKGDSGPAPVRANTISLTRAVASHILRLLVPATDLTTTAAPQST